MSEAAKQFITENTHFLILGHKDPDGDCIGSQLALAHFLNRIGKSAVPVSEGPFERNEIYEYEHYFQRDFSGIENLEKYVAIIMDCSNPERAGDIGTQLKDFKLLVIDHHNTTHPFGMAEFIEPLAVSTTYLVQLLIEQLGHTPDLFEAELLLLGLCTDTGFFRHIDGEHSEVFNAAGRLVKIGASTKTTFKQMYGGVDFDDRKLLATVLLRTQKLLNAKILLSWVSLEDKRNIYGGNFKSDELYKLLQLTKETEVVVLIKQEQEDRCSISFRSNGPIKVDTMARDFGGGGHTLAAGCEVSGTLDEVRERVIKYLEEKVSV